MLGALDGTYTNYLTFFGSKDHCFFNNGVGDKVRFEACRNMTLNAKGEDLLGLRLEMGEVRNKHGLSMVEGSGASLMSEYLYCDEAKTLRTLILEKENLKPEERKGVVIHLAGTGDQGYGLRRKISGDALARKGFTNIILMAAGCGARKPRTQKRHYVDTVSDYLVCCLANFIDGCSLINWVRDQYPGSPLAITGMSFGGTSAISATCLDCFSSPHPIAVVPFLPPPSADHLLSTRFFLAQMNLERMCEVENKEKDELLAEISDMFAQVDLRSWLMSYTPFEKARENNKVVSIVYSYAKHDAVVSQTMTDSLVALLQDKVTHFDLHDIDGGHLSSIIMGDSERVNIVKRVEEALGYISPKL